MKTTTTPEQIQSIIGALEKLHIHPFQHESCDAKRDAQANLRNKTHYVDDETLRWHKSRVLSTAPLHEGLLFRITCSDAMDMHNTKRGFRSVVFDAFGTTIDRCGLEDAASTKHMAIKRSDMEEIDLVAHYRDAIARELKNREQAAQDYQAALLAMPSAA